MATTTTVTTTKGNKTTSVTTTNERPGAAWIDDGKGNWVKPPQPAGDFAWDDQRGWVSSAEQASIYAIPLSVIQADSELNQLFNEAWSSQKAGMEWSKDYFTTRLKSLNWYKTKSEAERKYYLLSKDPAQAAEFQAQINASIAKLGDAAGSLGITLNETQLNEFAHTVMRLGLNDSEIRNSLANYINYEGKSDLEIIGSLYGEAGNYEDQIRNWAKKNNVTVSNDWVLGQVKGIVSGNFTVDKANDFITNIARQQNPGWSDRLDASTSLLDLAGGYRQIISDEMDQAFDTVDFSNDYLRNVINATDANGRPVSNDSLKTTLRKSDEWASIKKNKEKVLNVANDLMNKFGLM